MRAMFDIPKFQSLLHTRTVGRALVHFDKPTSSSQDHGRYLMNNGVASGTVLLAETQTKGRGRNDRAWTSKPGECLTFSVCLKLSSFDEAVKLNSASAIAVALSCRELGISTAGVKWPNDVWVNNRKLCGILVDVDSDFDVVLGIGVNVNMKSTFNDEIATSLFMESGKEISREELLARICNTLERLMETEDIRAIYNSLDILLGKQVVVMPKRIEDTTSHYFAKVHGYTSQGYMIIEKEDGSKKELSAEEVSVREYVNAYTS